MAFALGRIGSNLSLSSSSAPQLIEGIESRHTHNDARHEKRGEKKNACAQTAQVALGYTTCRRPPFQTLIPFPPFPPLLFSEALGISAPYLTENLWCGGVDSTPSSLCNTLRGSSNSQSVLKNFSRMLLPQLPIIAPTSQPTDALGLGRWWEEEGGKGRMNDRLSARIFSLLLSS